MTRIRTKSLGISRLTTSVAFATLLALATNTGEADAQTQLTDDERARSHFIAGSSYFDQGRFVDAAEQFYEAYRLSGRVALLLNAATSYERAGRPGDAATMLTEWLARSPADASGRHEQEIRLAQLRLAQDEIDRRDAELAERRAAEQAASATAIPETAAPDEGGLSGLGVTGISLLSFGAASGIVSLGTGIAASARQGELEDGCSADRVCPASLEETRDRGRALARASTATLFLSVASLGTGLTLLLVDVLGDDDADASITTARGRTIRATGGPGDLGFGLQLTF